MLFIHYEVSNTTYFTHHCNFTSFSFEYLLTITVFESQIWGDVRLWGTGAKAVSFVPYTPVSHQLQFLNVLTKLAQTLFRRTVWACGLERILKIWTMKNHSWPQTKFLSIVELLWISSRHVVVDLNLECTYKLNFYMILRVTVFALAASLKLMLSKLLSRKIRSDLDWPVHLLLVCANVFNDKNINATYNNTLNYVWIEKFV